MNIIYRVRTINLGLERAASSKVAIKAAAYVTEHYPGVEVVVLENVTGPLNQIHMVTRCESLAAFEAYEAKRKTDSGWLALIDEFSALEPGSQSVDRLYRTLA